MADLIGIDPLSAEFALVIATSVAAGLIRGFTGFGSGLIMAPVFSLMYGPVVAVPTVIMIEILASAHAVPHAARDVPWRAMIPIWVAAWMAVPLGSWLLVSADPDLLRRAISALVVIVVLVLMTGWRYRGAQTLGGSAVTGALSGFLNAGAGMGGPPVILYILSGPLDAARARAGLIWNVFVVSTPTLVLLTLNGAIPATTAWRTVVLFVPFLAAMLVGNRLFLKASETTFRRAALWFLLAVGIATLVAD